MAPISNRRATFWLCLLALGLVLISGTTAVACPTCKDGLSQNDPTQQNVVRGYFWSILFMMSMPFLLIGGFSLYMYLEIRKARAAAAQGAPSRQPTGQQGSRAPLPSPGG